MITFNTDSGIKLLRQDHEEMAWNWRMMTEKNKNIEVLV